MFHEVVYRLAHTVIPRTEHGDEDSSGDLLRELADVIQCLEFKSLVWLDGEIGKDDLRQGFVRVQVQGVGVA